MGALLAWPLLAAPPRIFFSDLESGPNSGGQNNGGAFVSIYGAGFGSSRGNSVVTIGGGAALGYPIWTSTRITIQLGAAAKTGNITVKTPAGVSNGVPFTVRPGDIYFVATTGKDSNSGSFSAPWLSLPKARDAIRPGDIVYALDGVSLTTGDEWDAALLLRSGGSDGLPKALIAYPGATVTIGSVGGPLVGIRSTDFSAGGGACPGYWVFAGLTLRGSGSAMALAGPSSKWRIVGNDMSCPNGDGAAACFETAQATWVTMFGNRIHQAGKENASALYHGVYFSTDSNHLDVGWNTIEYVRGCRGLQVHSSPMVANTGFNQYDIAIHDNLIHDTQCDGIDLATVDPSKGKVAVFNNIIYNAGQGPNNRERTGHWSCILVAGNTNAGSPGGGVVDVSNNTLYNCGSFATPPYADSRSAISNGGHNPNLRVWIRNNIVYQLPGAPYLTIWTQSGICRDSSNCSGIYGTNNLFFGNGPAPSNTNIARSVSRDPLLADVSHYDFHLRADSPARKAGVATDASTDKDGFARGGDAGIDLGALQFVPAGLADLRCDAPFLLTPGSLSCSLKLTASLTESVKLAIGSDNPDLIFPGDPELQPGQAVFNFPVKSSAVAIRIAATISATLAGSSRSATLWLLPPGDSGPAILSVLNGASLLPGSLAPGGIVTVMGLNLGPPTPLAAAQAAMTVLGGTSAEFDGVPAELIWVSAGQLNAVAPPDIAGKAQVQLAVVANGLRSNPVDLSVSTTAPGIFTLACTGTGPAVAWNEYGTLNSSAVPAQRAAAVTFYATGLGETERDSHPIAPLSVSVAGLDAGILLVGAAPGLPPGLFQIQVRLPDLGTGGSHPLLLKAGAAESQPGVTVAVQ
ncbi:MAG: IPT/TIG domain-containing protein [Acidobacteria bacterium]|nr:IPT/TIG domain-containing protein [Acidobacteriota bacterium]